MESKRRPGITKSLPSSRKGGDISGKEMTKRAVDVVTQLAKQGIKAAMPSSMSQLLSLENKLKAMNLEKRTSPTKKPTPMSKRQKIAPGSSVALKTGGSVVKKGNFTKRGPCK